MIRELRWLLGARHRQLNLVLATAVVTAVLQGVTFVLLVPLLRALIGGDIAGAWPWAIAVVVAAVAYSLSMWVSSVAGQRVAIDLATGLYERVGDKIARLPLGAIDLELTGRLARLTSKGVMQVATVPAHLVRPIIHALGTPVTVVIGMAVIDWRIGLAALLSLPLLALTYRLTTAIVGKRDTVFAAATADAAGRIVEFAQVQPALRAFGGSRAAHHELERALGRQSSSYRALLLGGSVGMSGFVLAVQAVVTVVIVVATSLALGGKIGRAHV